MPGEGACPVLVIVYPWESQVRCRMCSSRRHELIVWEFLFYFVYFILFILFYFAILVASRNSRARDLTHAPAVIWPQQ